MIKNLNNSGGTNMQSNQEKIGQVENGLRPEYFIKGDKLKSITEVMKETNTPGISVAIIHNSEIVWTKGYGIADTETQMPVNTNTIFQAASISKPLTALAVMKLVQEGKLDLDENINLYLKTWKLPENEFTAKNKVTLRNLLSHTAGVTVHGFSGYKSDANMPTLMQVLNGELPANSGEIVVDMEPNTESRYSGGGYTIVQQVLIDQLQKTFQEIMRDLVLEPLGMTNSFYSNATLNEKQCTNATAGHNDDGKQVLGKRHLYPEMAAAGLWTTAEDLAKFSIEVQKSLKGESSKILTKEFMEVMTTPVLNGECNIGLFNEKVCRDQLLEHDGGNEGYTCSIQFHKEKGYGVVLMSNSQRGYEIKMPLFISAAVAYSFDNILHRDYEIVALSVEEVKLFSGNYRMEVDKTVKISHKNNKVVYKTIFDELKQLDYVGSNIMIDINRAVKFELREDSSELYMNEKKLERLNIGEKLASDYIEEDNIEQAVICYQELMKKNKDMKNQLENKLNNEGYGCVWRKDYNTAIAFLKINTILFPESANCWDSLGEAYFSDKQYELSMEAMKKSLEYNPSNKNALEFIKDAKKHLKCDTVGK
jgi:CubicO group peptidase (beta-lactamase class C family)